VLLPTPLPTGRRSPPRGLPDRVWHRTLLDRRATHRPRELSRWATAQPMGRLDRNRRGSDL